VISSSKKYIEMEPCGVPLSMLVDTLFAHRKLLSLEVNPDNDEVRTTVVPSADALPPTRPIGLLFLAFVVLQHVSKALSLAHDNNFAHSDLRIGNVILASWSTQDRIFVKQPVIVVDRGIEAFPAPCFNTALLVDWGNALIIGNVTADLPGNLLSSADAVLLELSTNNRTNWVPLAKYDWESLAYLYWDIASPRLAQCPWRKNWEPVVVVYYRPGMWDHSRIRC